MKDISNIKTAAKELLQGDEHCPPDDPDDRKVGLAKKLEAEGKKVILVGRGLATIERTDHEDKVEKVGDGWGILKITTYSDPDVSGIEGPDSIIYIQVGRYGLSQLQLGKDEDIQSLI